jgi:hypothetical protein
MPLRERTPKNTGSRGKLLIKAPVDPHRGSETMDITTIPCGSATRDEIAKFRDTGDYANYDEALQAMLNEVGAEA